MRYFKTFYKRGEIMKSKYYKTRYGSWYVNALLWAEVDNFGKPLEFRYAENALTIKARDIIENDIGNFLNECNRQNINIFAYKMDEVMHKFHLTRNRHGTGFWDWEALSDHEQKKLTEIAHSFPSICMYEINNGYITIV